MTWLVARICLLLLAVECAASGPVMHATPAEGPPIVLIRQVFDRPFEWDARVLIYAQIRDRNAYALGIRDDGRVVGLHRRLPVATEEGVQYYPVQRLEDFKLPPGVVPFIKDVIVTTLRDVRFPQERDMSTGGQDVFVVGSSYFFGEIRESYRGSAEGGLEICTLLVKLMAEGELREANLKKLLEWFDKRVEEASRNVPVQ